MTTDPTETAVSTFLRAEVLAARLEAMARAEPEVGNLWRSELAIAEAVASAGLEGIRISEADLLPRVARNGDQGADPAGAELALSLVRALKSPGDPLARPVTTLRRFDRAVGISSYTDPEADHPTEAEIKAIFAGLTPGDMPILTAARAAASYAALTRRANPMIERLIFMAVDSSLRGRAPRKTGPEDVLRGLSGRVDAHWVAPPALALSHQRFQPWSPGSETGLMNLGHGLAAVFEAEMGRFALSRDWLRRGQEAAQGRGGRSRMADVARAFAAAPVLSSALLADAIGISIRTALTLLDELTDLGLLREITGRRTARIWAVPSLGARLMARPPRRNRPLSRAAPLPQAGHETATTSAQEQKDAAMRAMERAFADLDAALGQASALMIGTRPRK